MNQAALALPEPARDEQAVRLLLGDCLEVLRGMADGSVDSIVTDPPAGIAFMGKAWDKDKGGRAQWIAWMTEVAAECLRVLKPGGHALVWSLPRTSHWTATAWEDAGFECRDRIAHCFGSGFPKSQDISKAIDKAAGMKREVVGRKADPRYSSPATSTSGSPMGNISPRANGAENYAKAGFVTAPATDAAKQLAGYGSALKPAVEDWWLLRKPLDGTIANNVLKHGVGGLNIDGCRVGGGYCQDGTEIGHNPNIGRFPANLIHDGSPEVVALFPQTTPSPSKPITGVHNRRYDTGCAIKPELREVQGIGYGDQGSAARFFQSCFPDPEPDPLVYCAKASRADRDAGLDQFEEQRCGLMEDDAYQWQHDGRGHQYQRDTRRKNTHPTVKPTSLMRYLCRLITPPGGVCLDPFMGSGSTGKAAVMEGFRFIGIERDPEYLEIARARIAAAQSAMIL